MANGVLKMTCTFLAGVVLAGGGMLVRGDALGGRAAQEVEARLTKNIDDEVGHLRELLETHTNTLQRMENKLDVAIDRIHERED